jgi:hypothetical protein
MPQPRDRRTINEGALRVARVEMDENMHVQFTLGATTPTTCFEP